MKQFSLEEYLKDPNRKVVTRDGRNVIIHCTNYSAHYPIVAEIQGIGYSDAFYPDGRYSINANSLKDLFFAPEKREGWINLFRDSTDNEIYCSKVYPTKEKAMNSIGDFYATIKVEWEE